MGGFDLLGIPLFAGLPKVVAARILPEIQVVQLAEGERLTTLPGDRVAILYQGEAELIKQVEDEELPLVRFKPGELLLECDGAIEAASSVTILHFPRRRLEELIAHHPHAAATLRQQTERRLQETQEALARSRRLLNRFADRLWQDVGAPPLERVAVTAQAVAPAPLSVRESSIAKRASPWVRPALMALLITVTALAPLLIFKERVHPALLLVAIFIGAGVNWALSTMPDHVVALGALFATGLVGLVSLDKAFGGFANSSWWLLVAVLGLVAVVNRTGILYRVALFFLRTFPSTYLGQMMGLFVTGLVLTPCLPNTNVRVSVLGPLAQEIGEAIGCPPRSKGTAGLAMAAYMGASQLYFLFLNGATMTMMLWGILPPETKQQITWAYWLVVALPMALVLTVGFMIALMLWYRPAEWRAVDKSTIKLQQAVLGPLTRAEWQAGSILLFLILAFITEPLHQISSVWLAMGAFLVAMGAKLLDREALKAIDWSLIFYMGAVISLSAVGNAVGLNQFMAEHLATLLSGYTLNPVFVLIAIGLVTILLRLFVPPPVVTVGLTLAVAPLAAAIGISPFLVGLVVVAFCSSWLVPQQWSVYLNLIAVTKERSFTHEQVAPLAWLNNALLFVGVLVSVPFWEWLGLMH